MENETLDSVVAVEGFLVMDLWRERECVEGKNEEFVKAEVGDG